MYRDASFVAGMLITGAMANGGETVSPMVNGEIPNVGYVVGGLFTLALPTSDLTFSKIVSWVERHRADVQTLGSWVDGDTIYFDGGEIFHDKNVAARAARMYGEIAYWDLANGREIRTESTD